MDLSGKDPYVPLYVHSTVDLSVKILARGIHRVAVVGSAETKESFLHGMFSQTDALRILNSLLEEEPSMASLKKNLMDQSLITFNLHKKELQTISQDSTVQEAFEKIAQYGVSALAVVNNKKQLVGNFSASDLRQLSDSSKWSELGMTVLDFLQTCSPRSLEPATVSQDAALFSVMSQMVDKTGRTEHRLWVTNENDEPVSVVSMTDVLRAVVESSAGQDPSSDDSIAQSASLRFYTPKEVALHDTPADLWVSLLGRVYNLTPLVSQYKGSPLVQPLYQAAGTDISHWFDASGNVKTWIDPITNSRAFYTPMGRFVHVPSPHMTVDSDQEEKVEKPWWMDGRYQIGQLATKTRMIRIVNTLTHQDHEMEVSTSETLNQILQRYKEFNDHAGSYTWKRLGKILDMNKTLSQNGIEEEDEELTMTDNYIPTLHIYYNDDLKFAVDD
mmetsp:Transcript_5282/g.19745  ORF Transcript_5282/g.19745 Transcript_5282/m.19745 type:complete len:444 (-) Transcript_5282:56-1387(-)